MPSLTSIKHKFKRAFRLPGVSPYLEGTTRGPRGDTGDSEFGSTSAWSLSEVEGAPRQGSDSERDYSSSPSSQNPPLVPPRSPARTTNQASGSHRITEDRNQSTPRASSPPPPPIPPRAPRVQPAARGHQRTHTVDSYLSETTAAKEPLYIFKIPLNPHNPHHRVFMEQYNVS